MSLAISTPSTSARNPWLDVCRASAILLVLFSHGRVFLRQEMPWVEMLRFGGFMGVELFFVLSGFLIGSILIRLARNREKNWLRGFYIRRWFRTLPNYFMFLMVNLALLAWGIRSGTLDAFWLYPFFLQNFAWPQPVFFAESWSLAVEEIFYLLFPVLFIALGRLLGCGSDRSILFAALIVIFASLLARFAVAASVSIWDEDLRKVAVWRFDTLMYGVLLAWLYDRHSEWIRQPSIVWGLLTLFGLASA
jgi:peptidoglycan/LPS O-acetylase OafA/YrhL